MELGDVKAVTPRGINVWLRAQTTNIVSLEGGASGGGRLEIVEESFVRCRDNSTPIFLQLAVQNMGTFSLYFLLSNEKHEQP